MGTSLGNLKCNLAPLTEVSERFVRIPAHEILTVKDSEDFRILFFLEEGLEVQVSGGERFSIGKGDVLTVEKNLELLYQAQNAERDVLIHALRIRLRQSDFPNALETAFWELAGPSMAGVHHYPERTKRFGSLDLVKQIRIELERGEEGSDLRMSGLCLALIVPLFDGRAERLVASDRFPLPRGEIAVQHACQYIQDYAHHDLDLGRIAWQVQLSGEHLGRLFRKHLGMTVMNYLKQIRLEKVTYFLMATDMPVVNIARRTGYSNPSLLCRHFKEKTGMTPVTYRIEARKREKFSPSHLRAGKD